MKIQTLVALGVLGSALTAFAAPTCNSAYVVQGNNCVFTAAIGWAIAGLGTQSTLTLYVPPQATGPIDFEVTGLSSSLGNSYKGYLGIVAGDVGQKDTGQVTLADIGPGSPDAIGQVFPGQVVQFFVKNVCWDPTCTSAAPAGAVPNMFSMTFSMASPVSADLDITPTPRGTVQFLKGTEVTWQENVPAQRPNSAFSIIPGISTGATSDQRYAFDGGAVTTPFDTLSISNLNNPNPIAATMTLKDLSGNVVATSPAVTVPAGGANGYLLVGRYDGDPLGLFPSNTVLPAAPDGLFHGTLVVATTGQVAGGMCIIMGQEYNGFSMLNLPVFHVPHP